MTPTFSHKDLYFLMLIMDTEILIGFSNPFEGKSHHEISLEWKKTREKLDQLQLLKISGEDVQMEEQFQNALWIMSRTNLVVEIVKDGLKKSYFYFSRQNVVECAQMENGEYTLYMHSTPEVTWNDVIYPRMLTGVEERRIRTNDKIYISPTEYNKWVKENRMEHTSEDSLTFLRQAFSQKIHNHRIMLFHKGDTEWKIEGLHVLTSPEGNWVLKMINKDGVELLEGKQSTNIGILSDILALLQTIMENQQTIAK